MQAEQIIKLVDAGFTKEEIIKLSGATVQKPTEVKEEQKAPEAEPKPQSDETLNTVLAEIKTALSDLRKAAITNDEQPQQESVDDILASMLK